MINPKKEPFTDPRVRKAIYLALDRQQIDDIVLDNTSGEPSIFMPGMAYDESEAVTWPGLRPKNTPGGQEDLAEAKWLMAEAGFADGFKTTYDARKVSFYVPICQVVKEQLKTALNITGDLQTWESAAGYKHYGTARAVDAEGDWGLACQGEGMVVLDADAVFGGVYRPGGTRNYSYWSDPRIEELFQLQKVEQDLDKRREILREAADILREGDNHWVTLVWGRFFWQMHRDVKGFNPPQTVQYGFKHEDLWLDR
jgi:peptide/nickel transport system substrate-binding protein